MNAQKISEPTEPESTACGLPTDYMAIITDDGQELPISDAMIEKALDNSCNDELVSE